MKARIEEFNALAGYEHVHKGMTSRDLTENVEQLQILLALRLVSERMISALVRLGELAARYADQPIAGTQPQCRGPGDDAGQALRDRRGGAADRVRAGGLS